MKGITFFLLLITFSALHPQTVTLRDTTNHYDYIIITVPEFVNACEPFRQHKETVRDFRTLIVDTTQIFAEFDSSVTPQDNIRDFISYAGTFWKEPRPEYFLFAGNRSKLPNFDDIFDFAGYLDTAHTDYKFTVNKFGSDTLFSSFQIGRVPAYSTLELYNYFNKVITYEVDTTYSGWMNNNLVVLQCYPDTSVNEWFANTANSIMNLYPDYFFNYLFTENDTMPNYGNRDSILNFLNTQGATSLWLIGNTFNYQFGYYNILDTGDVKNFNNNPKNFIAFFLLRQFFSSDDSAQGLADRLLLDENSSIAVVAPVGYTFASQNNILFNTITEKMFGLIKKNIGKVLNETRIQLPNTYSTRMINLWGDPSLILKYDITVFTEYIDNGIPNNFLLYQNYPNPFNPSTTIKFALPVDSRVKINVYNSLGQLVETLVDGEMQSGYHEVNFNASRLASGVYLYQLQAGEYVSVKKMLMIK